MTTLAELPEPERARLRAAAAWKLRIDEWPATGMSPEFQDWVQDARNLRAFEAVEKSWVDIEEFAASEELLEMRRAALNRISSRRQRWAPWTDLARKVAAVLLVATLGGGAIYFHLTEPTLYATAINEQRQIQLPDGSRIHLDSGSWLRVKYTKTARAVVLDRGRARFDVAHDRTRPFSVTAGAQTVVAVGTAFDVERLSSAVLVTMIQGRVIVKGLSSNPQGRETAVPLSAGQELVAGLRRPFVTRPADLANATAWETGHLVFKGAPLSEAVERVNRYAQHPITVDPSAASIRVSGIFKAGDANAFVSAVTSYLPVQAAGNTGSDLTLESRP